MTHAVPHSGSNAASLLMQHREQLARRVTDELYRERPHLIDKHGERGREKCLQDMRYNIDQLIPAVDLGDGGMFARYVQWLDAMLRARNVDTSEVVRCLELLRDACAAEFPAPDSAVVGDIIAAGLGVLTT